MSFRKRFQRLRDVFLKLKDLTTITNWWEFNDYRTHEGLRVYFKVLRSRFLDWKTWVWDRDMDDYFCCSGYDTHGLGVCGCQGMTVREMLEYKNP